MTNPVIGAVPGDAAADSFAAIRTWIRDAALKANELIKGKRNSVRLWTLTANAASTTFTDVAIGIATNIIMVPTTANASAEIGAGTIYVSETGRVNGSVVVTHANNANADRTFRVTLDG